MECSDIMENEITSVIDLPLTRAESDLLQVDDYRKALSRFINNSETPITIAIQGEWGSGKTSFMNLLEENLCEEENSQFYPIWINAWHYSLMREPSETLVGVIKAIIDQVTKNIDTEQGDARDKIEKVLRATKKVSLGALKIALKTSASKVVAGADEVVDQIFDDYGDGNIAELRSELQDLISSSIKKNEERNINKKGFLIFIDDLDRIDPPVAVTILELFKNIFDLKHCVFVLAIDYEVVVKGLKPKFGELTDKNEREFRSFFDKIIQLNFQLPVRSYVIDSFLHESLVNIKFITNDVSSNEKYSDEEFLQYIKEFADLSVGSNPRSLKRLINILSLIKLIIEAKASGVSENSESIDFNVEFNREDKLITFAMVCIQITYPAIYNLISERPDMQKWDSEFAQKMKLETIPKDQIDDINKLEEFDEEWEQVLYRACLRDPFLSRMVFKISRLLNKIKHLLENSEQSIGEKLESIIQYSSVTNIETTEHSDRDINRSRVLNSIHEKLHPLLKNKCQKPFNKPQKKGKRVQSVLRYNFRGKDQGKDVIGLELDTSKSKVVFSVGYYHYLCDRNSKDLKEDVSALGKMELYKKIKDEFDQLSERYPLFTAVFEKYSGRKDHWLYIYYKFEVDEIDEILEDSFIETLSELIADYMRAYSSIEEFRSA